ncbi:MAG TPA: ATP-binding cassette domain-containing protein, partial [Micromonosporaceae bacterium]
GPNGSGKTTLMKVLIGELAPSAGTVDVCGVDLAGAGERDRSRLRGRQIGLVDQHHGRSLRPELSVLDNVGLQLRLAGASARSARRRGLDLLDRLGLAELAPRRPVTLSGGEAQRASVCAAVAHQPELILADEPTGELDQDSADSVYDLLVAAADACGAALLVVSHDVRASRIAHRIIRIRDGRLSEEWAPGLDSTESLVVDDRGWLRLPEPLRRRAGVLDRAYARVDAGSIVLVPPESTADRGPATPELAAGGAGTRAAAGREPHFGPGDEVARLAGVTVDRDRRRILAALDLTVPAGRLTAVTGRSGSGKTTLLRVLCGLDRPDAGAVRVAGHDLAELDRTGLAAMRRRHVSIAGQSTALLETADVVENIELIRLSRQLPAGHDQVRGWIDMLGLTAVRHRPVRVLSGGERQRVAVARVLAAEPDLAVFDEPTSRQDEAHAELVVAALARAAGQGIAVLAATHDPVLIGVADQELALDSTGRLVP